MAGVVRSDSSGEIAVVSDPRWGGAAGLSSVRRGFATSPDYDVLFALGWPHIRFVVDGHREDEEPQAHALRILAMPEPPARFAWPRMVAQGVVRAWGLPSIFELAPGVQGFRLAAEEAVWRPEPITAEEAADLGEACQLAGVAGALPIRRRAQMTHQEFYIERVQSVTGLDKGVRLFRREALAAHAGVDVQADAGRAAAPGEGGGGVDLR